VVSDWVTVGGAVPDGSVVPPNVVVPALPSSPAYVGVVEAVSFAGTSTDADPSQRSTAVALGVPVGSVTTASNR